MKKDVDKDDIDGGRWWQSEQQERGWARKCWAFRVGRCRKARTTRAKKAHCHHRNNRQQQREDDRHYNRNGGSCGIITIVISYERGTNKRRLIQIPQRIIRAQLNWAELGCRWARPSGNSLFEGNNSRNSWWWYSITIKTVATTTTAIATTFTIF